jgi:Zn-dependent protease
VSNLGLNITPATIITIAIFLLVAFPIHEFFHALVAYRLGDATAKLYGRLTLNPVVHFDPIGGGALAVLMLLGSSFVFGWAKPTPVNPLNLRGGHRGEAIVALAGPASNAVMAIAAAIPVRFILAIFNFLPIPPLDGSKLLLGALDPRTAYRVRPMLDQYGFVILLVAILPIVGGQSLIGIVVTPLIDAIFKLLVGI